MLVLSRMKDESVMIGDEIEITIVGVRCDKVRLGIAAPKQMPVYRREMYDAIQREKSQGGAISAGSPGGIRGKSPRARGAMMVVSREKDESIMIGDDVEITIVDVRGDKVRLGITAPRSIAVHRKEVYEAIQREKKEKLAQQ